VRIFGIDPGSLRTGYGCIESDGSRHRLIACGAIAPPRDASFPDKLLAIHDALDALISTYRPDCVAVEDVFHASNVRSALLLGHARGVALALARTVGAAYPYHAPRGEAPDAVLLFAGGETKLELVTQAAPVPFFIEAKTEIRNLKSN